MNCFGGGMLVLSRQRGKRDYALLAVLLQAGRQLQEVATLQLQHITIRKDKATISFGHCKGDKEMRDTLPTSISKSLIGWIHAYYGSYRTRHSWRSSASVGEP